MWTVRSTCHHDRRGRPSLLAAVALSTMLAGCNELLEVDLPGVVKSEDLNNPDLAPTLVNGVIGDFECAWSNYTSAGGLIAGEWISGSPATVGMFAWMQRNLPQDDRTVGIGNCVQFYGVYTTLHTARYQSEHVYGLLDGFDEADVPNKTELQGITRAYGGYSLLALGEGFCSMAIDGGPELTRDEVFALAETRFDEAISLLTGTTNTSVLNMALVGRARVKGDQKDWAGALADATLVPKGFSRVALREDAGNNFERFNKYVALLNELSARNGSVANHYRDLRIKADGTPTAYCSALGVSPAAPCDGPEGAPFAAGEVADPRVSVVDTKLLNRDGITPFIMHKKYALRSDDIPLASYEEAQLYVAEAQAHLGNLNDAMATINGLRPAGLPLYQTPTTLSQTAVIDAVLEERRRVMFQAASIRWNDLLRYDGTANDIPWNGEPGSIHPNGKGPIGQDYGTMKCILLPTVEIGGNPNIP